MANQPWPHFNPAQASTAAKVAAELGAAKNNSIF
jgi:hypothetical protein